jgi:beta-lactam-binding protein with PASTA domain
VDTATTDTLLGFLVDGRYLIRERIARGGMAVVFRAHDQRLDRDVALKIMHAEMAEDAGFVSKFIDEGRSMSRLSRHPDIVTIYDQGATDGLVWIAMELVEGQTLRQVLARHQSLSPQDALAVMGPALHGLAAAHRDGIVHRDVKPENVLLGTDGRIQVADLGLAKVVESAPRTNATREVLLGTVAYIAPELALGEAATPRSDVYAAGIVLYELLVGRPPHTGPTDYVIVRRHVDEDVPPPSQHVDGIPAAVDTLVTTATARDPRERFADATAFVWALERAVTALGGASDHRHLLGDPAAAAEAPAESGEGTRGLEAAGDAPDGPRPAAAPPGRAARPAAPRRPARRRLMTLLWLLAVLLLAGGAATGAWYWAEGRWMPTPDLLGMTQKQAERAASAEGLGLQRDGRAYSEEVPRGRVLSTEPAPGDQVLREGTVTVVVSRGPERYPVPDLVGMDADRAAAAIQDSNMVIGEVSQAYDEQVPEGSVVSQELAVGTQVPPGTSVSVVISRGPEPIEVPDVVGEQVAAAVSAIESARLVAETSEEFSDEVPRGGVISQRPANGTLFSGDTVRLVVSKGPPRVEVPDVEGLSAEEAVSVLRDAGLSVRDVVLLPAGPGNVLRQAPGGGDTVESGSEVTIYIF